MINQEKPDKNFSIGRLLFRIVLGSIPGTIEYPLRLRNNINLPSFNDIESIFTVIHNLIYSDIKNAFYNIGVE